MPVNIEIKAVARNLSELKKVAAVLSTSNGQTLIQRDTFYKVPVGRLKLRRIQNEPSQLIFYDRSDEAGPKHSDYVVAQAENPDHVHNVLERVFGIRGDIRKHRTLHLVGQTRVHLDEVEGLGDFVELEVMLHDGQSDAEGKQIADGLMSSLDIKKEDLLSVAYIDLIERLEPKPIKDESTTCTTTLTDSISGPDNQSLVTAYVEVMTNLSDTTPGKKELLAKNYMILIESSKDVGKGHLDKTDD